MITMLTRVSEAIVLTWNSVLSNYHALLNLGYMKHIDARDKDGCRMNYT